MPATGSTSMLEHLQNELEADMDGYKVALKENEDRKRQKGRKTGVGGIKLHSWN
jgi:hypothetical protein